MQLNPATAADYQKYKDVNSSDAYSARCVSYGEDWANLLEAKITETGLDPKVAIIKYAEKLGHQADTDGITGFMYGCAVKALAHFWVHGESLRRWHNKDIQLLNEGDEANKNGGVLNPAMLNIG